MLIKDPQPLEIAARILKPETLMCVRKAPYHLRAWKILDRWAMNSPEKLRALESDGEVILLGRLLEQQTLEHDLLTDSLEMMQAGASEGEILQMNEVATEL